MTLAALSSTGLNVAVGACTLLVALAGVELYQRHLTRRQRRR